MTIQELKIDNQQVQAVFAGSIYVEDAAEIMAKFIALIEQGYTTFVLDFSAVDYIDSSGIGTLIAIQKKVRHRDGSVVIKGLSGMARELFALTRVDKVLDIV